MEDTITEESEVADEPGEGSGGAWRAARLLGLLAGIAALVWAMRDRFISLVVPREPEPPTFRVAPPPPAAPTGTEPGNEDLTVIAGIGPVYQSRLHSAGFGTVAAVAEASPDELASAAQVPVGRATEWVRKAAAVSAKNG
jgi:Helix-hairpin-helix domain